MFVDLFAHLRSRGLNDCITESLQTEICRQLFVANVVHGITVRLLGLQNVRNCVGTMSSENLDVEFANEGADALDCESRPGQANYSFVPNGDSNTTDSVSNSVDIDKPDESCDGAADMKKVFVGNINFKVENVNFYGS
jgi:hypothetical protein